MAEPPAYGATSLSDLRVASRRSVAINTPLRRGAKLDPTEAIFEAERVAKRVLGYVESRREDIRSELVPAGLLLPSRDASRVKDKVRRTTGGPVALGGRRGEGASEPASSSSSSRVERRSSSASAVACATRCWTSKRQLR